MYRKTKSRKLAAILIALVLVVPFGCISFAETADADVVWVNGNIYTVDDDFSTASIIATKGDKIVYVGDDEDVAAKYVEGGAELVDLDGKTVIPGMIDSHLHIMMRGDNANTIWPWRLSKADTLKMIVDEADKFRAKGKWLVGMGFNQEAPGWLPNGSTDWPSVADLDAVVDDIPVVIKRQCSHTYWVNTKAIEESKLDLSTPEKIAAYNEELGDGGEIATDEDGNVLVFIRDATELIKIPQLTKQESIDALYALQEEAFENGITSVMDAGISTDEARLFAAEYKNDLKLRIYGELNVSKSLFDDKAAFDDVVKSYNVDKNGTFTLRTVKLILDGSLGSGSAAMMKDYSDAPGEKGYLRFTDEDLYEVMKASTEKGFQISAHAIGDASNRQFIDTFEKVVKDLKLDPKNHNLRPRIEPFQIVDPNDIKRAIGMNIIPSMQFIHATSDMGMAGKRVGPRIDGSYAWKTIVDLGGIIANGTDAPVEAVNPFEGLYSGVTKINPWNGDGPEDVEGYTATTIKQWHEQVVSREDALRGYTIWGAYAQFEEDIKGSLEEGKLADFVVLDRDYMKCPVGEIKSIKVLATILGGEVVYGSVEGTGEFPFTDVAEGAWYYNDVKYVFENGLMTGTSADKFSPGANLTRGMIVTILHRVEDTPSIAGLDNPFSDVPAGQWYTDAVVWAAENDIVTGYDGKFNPLANITRQDLAVILMRYMEYKEINLPITLEFRIYADANEIAAYASDAIQTLNKLGVINGTGVNADGQTIISPRGNATRAQAAAMFHRFLTLIEE